MFSPVNPAFGFVQALLDAVDATLQNKSRPVRDSGGADDDSNRGGSMESDDGIIGKARVDRDDRLEVCIPARLPTGFRRSCSCVCHAPWA